MFFAIISTDRGRRTSVFNRTAGCVGYQKGHLKVGDVARLESQRFRDPLTLVSYRVRGYRT